VITWVLGELLVRKWFSFHRSLKMTLCQYPLYTEAEGFGLKIGEYATRLSHIVSQELAVAPLALVAVPVFLGAVLVTGSCIQAVESAWHRCVLVDFVCGNCEKKFSITYEICQTGKCRNTGRYLTDKMRILGTSAISHSLESIDKFYDEMFENYNVLFSNCQHWADKFYEKLS